MSLRAEAVEVDLAGRRVLSGASLEAAPGRITGLVGPNGAGKSTLMRALAGLVPLAGGRVTLDGACVATMPATQRGRRIAYLPQDRTVHWPLAVHRIVSLGRLPYGTGSIADASGPEATAVVEALAAMDVLHLAERSVEALSGGERARVLFARALAQEAPVILADEPTAGLDPAHALGLFEVLQRLACAGRTIVVALHDLSLAARYCHAVALIADGRIAAAGPPGDVLTPERLAPVLGAHMAVGTVGGVPVVVPLEPIRGHGKARDDDRG